VLLDINLPGMDGLDALRLFRAQMAAPVIFLTARRRELDEVVGLELGADDYVTKPFDLDVLLAHIKAVLRRARQAAPQAPPQPPLSVGGLAIDPAAHTVHLDGKPVDLSPREFDVLYTLALEAGRVVSVDELLSRVWGAEFAGQPQVVYVHIRWLREKLEDDPRQPRRILTVRGVGYRLLPG
jgi:DNA-binding response OmpR family regulator